MKFYQIQNTAIRLDTIVHVCLRTCESRHIHNYKVKDEYSRTGWSYRKEPYTITHYTLAITTRMANYEFTLPDDDATGNQKIYNDLMALLEGDE